MQGICKDGDSAQPNMSASSALVEAPAPREQVALSAPWTAQPAPWCSQPSQAVSSPPVRPWPSEQEAVAAAAAAAAAAVAGSKPPSPLPQASLAAPFPSLRAARCRPAGGKAAAGKKRSTTKGASDNSAAPLSKRNKTATGDAVGAMPSAVGTSPPPMPEAVATSKLVSSEVAKAVRNGTKEFWAALERSTA